MLRAISIHRAKPLKRNNNAHGSKIPTCAKKMPVCPGRQNPDASGKVQLVENGSKHNWCRACLFLWQVPSIAVAIPAAPPSRTAVASSPARAAQTNSTGSDFAALMDTLMPQIAPSAASADTVELVKAAPAKGGSQSGNGHAVDKDNPKEDKRKTDQDPSTPAPPLPQKAEPVLSLLDWAIPVQVPSPPTQEDIRSGVQSQDPPQQEFAAQPEPSLAQGISSLGATASPLLQPQALSKMTTPAAPERESLSALRMPADAKTDNATEPELAFEAELTPRETSGKPSTPAPSQPAAQPPTSPQLEAGRPAAVHDAAQEATPITPSTDAGAKDKSANPQPKPEQKSTANDDKTDLLSHAAEPVAKQAEPILTAATPAHAAKLAEHAIAKETAAPEAAAPLEVPEPALPRTEPARDISFRIASHSADAVDVKLIDRAGQIHVSVRSADPALTKSLQDNISDLAGKLERSGFHAETSIPGRTEPAREPQQNPNFQDSSRDRRAPQQESERPRKRTRPSDTVFSLNALQPIETGE